MKKCEKCFYYLQYMGMVEELKALKAQVREWAKRIENYPCTSMMSDQENPCFIETERVCIEMRKVAGGDK